MKKIILVGFSLVLSVLFTGCAPMMVSGGDAKIIQEGSTLAYGVTYTEKKVMPIAEQLPIKISNWNTLSRETRDLLSPFIHTTGDYLPVEIRAEFTNHGTSTESGFGHGYMVIKTTQYKDYAVIVINWTEDKNILLEIPVSGVCTAYRKTNIGDGGFDSAYIFESMNIADNNAIVQLVSKLLENKVLLEKYNKEYQSSKAAY